jgi:hypothetical protein
MQRLVAIRENYQEYVAPLWVHRTVERLLGSLAEAHTRGLSAIVLTNSARLTGRKGGRRSRRNRGGVTTGKYHPVWNGEAAWIELIVDEIVRSIPKPLHKLQLARDLAFGRVLFHEIGHHLHAVVGSAGREGESSAEAWQNKLSRIHLQKRYRYLRPLVPVLRVIARKLRARSQGKPRALK